MKAHGRHLSLSFNQHLRAGNVKVLFFDRQLNGVRTGGDLSAFETVDRLASVAGLAPAPRDSGRITGNHHRPRRYNRRLMRTCYVAALSSLKTARPHEPSTTAKRAEGKTHKQALISLARRRINTLWAMLRDHTTYQEPTPTSSGLTEALRFPVPWHRTVLNLGWTVGDIDHPGDPVLPLAGLPAGLPECTSGA